MSPRHPFGIFFLALNIHEIHAAFVKMQGTPGNSSCQEAILRCREVWKVLALTLPLLSTVGAISRVRPKKVQQAMQGVEKLKQDQADMGLKGGLVSDKDLNARGIGFYFGNMRWTSMGCSWMFMDKIYKILHQG